MLEERLREMAEISFFFFFYYLHTTLSNQTYLHFEQGAILFVLKFIVVVINSSIFNRNLDHQEQFSRHRVVIVPLLSMKSSTL